jgi:hypothetical protein
MMIPCGIFFQDTAEPTALALNALSKNVFSRI